MQTQTLTLTLPKAHPKQASIKASLAKRKVVCAGRRGGKTTVGAVVAVEKLLAGRRVLLASTTQEQADAFWDKSKAWLSPLIEAKIVDKNEQRRIMTFPSKSGRLKVKTAWDADSLRGDYADFLLLDECSRLAPNAWNEVGAPMLLDNDGDAWFISTPNRKNWFYDLYRNAQSDTTGRWQAWHFTSYDNPYLSREALSELTQDMSADAVQQEIMAEFIEGAGQVFRRIREAVYTDHTFPYEPYVGSFIIGLDFGQKHDFTVATVMDAHTRRVVDKLRLNKVDWAFQRMEITALYRKWHAQLIVAEANSIGMPNIEALVADNVEIFPFTTTNASKAIIIQRLVMDLENGIVGLPNDPNLLLELEAFEQEQTATGMMRYGAPEGGHDDEVMALALVNWACAGNQEVGIS